VSALFVEMAELADGALRAVRAGERNLVVCRAQGAWYALDDRCPHAFVPLSAGKLRGTVLECPLHGGTLDVRDGSPCSLPIRKSAVTHAVRPVPGGLEIELTPGAAAPQEQSKCMT
jgi:anthranilate 1,2-dioxygenase ferredoxin subunit